MLPVTAGRGTSRGQAGVWVSGYYYYYYWLVKGVYIQCKKKANLSQEAKASRSKFKMRSWIQNYSLTNIAKTLSYKYDKNISLTLK